MNLFLSVCLLIVFYLAHTSESIKYEDYCKMTQVKCNGYYDYKNKYNKKCDRLNCGNKYKYECSTGVCATSRQSCDKLIHTYHLVKSIKSSHGYHKEMNKLTKFTNSFRTCPPIKYDLSSNDFCVNGLNCYQVETYTYRNIRNNIEKLMVCPCIAEHTYHCGDFFCTVNSHACDSLKETNLKAFNNSMKKCGNDNNIIQKYVKLF